MNACLAPTPESGELNCVPDYDPGSFRDRDGRVCYRDGMVYRLLSPAALADWELLRNTHFFSEATARGDLIGTVDAADSDSLIHAAGGWAGAVEHERIPFISYPYEWCFSMLRDAALLQLDLLAEALPAGLNLKDGSPYNVQWRGVQPVFIDTPSFEAFNGTPFWPGYRQFCQLQLFPLLLQAWRGIAPQPLLRGSLEGLPPGQCLRMLSWRDLLRRGALTHVLLHAWLDGVTGTGTRVEGPRQGPEAVLNNVRGLRRLIAGLKWQPGTSTWSDYAQCNSYSEADRATKHEFVATAVGTGPRELVYDFGANTGEYSRLAAAQARTVIALDADAVAVERHYRSLRQSGPGNILPLVFDLADPSPGLGWRNAERKTLGDRGRAELVLALAVIHHLVIGRNLPLGEVLEWFAGLTDELVIEFVDLHDPMVAQMLANRRDRDPEYTLPRFEELLQQHFRIVRRSVLPSGTRTLFHVITQRS